MSRIYSVDFDGMKLYSNSGSIDGLVNKRLPNDHDHDLSDAIIDGLGRDPWTERGAVGLDVYGGHV